MMEKGRRVPGRRELRRWERDPSEIVVKEDVRSGKLK
jgi:hypothetical protein